MAPAHPPEELSNPRPSDPAFLFVTLLAARKAGDRMLESLARGWLAEQGITVRLHRVIAATREAAHAAR
jgi:hypothetical protein